MPLLFFLNLGGLLGTAAVALAVGAMIALDPGLVPPAYGDLAVSLVVLAVGGVLELTPLKPRCLAIPFWLLGAGMTVWHIARLWA